MKALFLDDNKERTEIVLSELPNCITVETASECIKALKSLNKEDWDLVMLDYDLDEVIKDKNICGCGMDVVRWICENKPNIKNILIHSRNYYGILEMTQCLQENGIKFMQVCFFDIDWKKLKEGSRNEV